MRFNKERNIFGPGRSAIQRGEGFGSFVTKIFQRILPYTKTVTKTGMKVLQNETVKDISKQIADSGVNAVVKVNF